MQKKTYFANSRIDDRVLAQHQQERIDGLAFLPRLAELAEGANALASSAETYANHLLGTGRARHIRRRPSLTQYDGDWS